MIKITQRPHRFCFSKNPVQFKFSVTNFAEPGCYVLIKIHIRDVNSPDWGDILYEEKIKPLTAEVAYNMATIVEASLQYSLPDFEGAAIQPGNNIKEYTISFATITDAEPVPSYTYDQFNAFYVIKGGIPSPQWDWNNYFINYVPGNKPFLTWQPGNRFIGKNDSFFISFLNSTFDMPMALRVDAEFTDGTPAQVLIDFTDNNKLLYHLQAGPDQLGLNALHTDKKLYKYSLSIVAAADHNNVIAGPYTYYIDYRKFYNTKFLHYYNSLGGIGCVRINGEIEITADITFTDSEVFEGSIIIGQPNSEQYTQTAKSKFDSFKGDSGFFFTKMEQDVLQELLLSRFAWERIIGKNWRIYSLNKSTKLRNSNDKKWSLGIEWRYSFTNSVYAPMIDLGDGADTFEYCVAVDIPGAPVMPDAVVGLAYAFSITLSGDMPVTLLIDNKPAWMEITLTDLHVDFSGTPQAIDATSDTPVSIRLTNCSGAEKPFSTLIDVIGYVEYLDVANYTGSGSTSQVCTAMVDFTRTTGATDAATAQNKRVQANYSVVADSGATVSVSVIFEPTHNIEFSTIFLDQNGYCSAVTVTVESLVIVP